MNFLDVIIKIKNLYRNIMVNNGIYFYINNNILISCIITYNY